VTTSGNHAIDRESESRYSLEIVACHQSATGVTSVAAWTAAECRCSVSGTLTIDVLDVNDNAPEFDPHQSYSVTLTGAEPIDHRVVQLRAVDRDATAANSMVVYRFGSVVSGDLFALDAVSGWITVNRRLTELRDQRLTLTVVAHDLGDPVLSSTAVVQISVQSGRPRITSPPNNCSLFVAQVSKLVACSTT